MLTLIHLCCQVKMISDKNFFVSVSTFRLMMRKKRCSLMKSYWFETDDFWKLADEWCWWSRKKSSARVTTVVLHFCLFCWKSQTHCNFLSFFEFQDGTGPNIESGYITSEERQCFGLFLIFTWISSQIFHVLLSPVWICFILWVRDLVEFWRF